MDELISEARNQNESINNGEPPLIIRYSKNMKQKFLRTKILRRQQEIKLQENRRHLLQDKGDKQCQEETNSTATEMQS